MTINSRDKGKRGELDFAGKLRQHGYEARRGQQFKGTEDSPDVETNLPVHFEVKWKQSVSLHPVFTQCKDESPKGKIPAVAWRKNRTRWLICFDADDILPLLKGL